MRKTLALLSIISTLSLSDVIGGEINLGYYNHIPNGSAQYKGDVLKLEDGLKFENEGDIFIKAYIEHPLPIIPNIKIGYTNFKHSGAGTVSDGFTFGDKIFSPNVDIKTNLDLEMYDLTLYYELLDNWLNFDVGVNLKYIDGVLNVKGTNLVTKQLIDESTDFQVPIPMLYGKVRLDVPATDLSFQVEGNYVTYDGHTLYDAEAGVRYTFVLGLGLEAGYKTIKLKLNDIDGLSMDADFSGAYGKLVWDF